MDITNPAQIGRAANQCPDVNIVINNAGIMKASTFIDPYDPDAARLEMETNYFGTLAMCRTRSRRS